MDFFLVPTVLMVMPPAHRPAGPGLSRPPPSFHLSPLDHVHDLDLRQSSLSHLNGFEAHHGAHHTLHGPVILLDRVEAECIDLTRTFSSKQSPNHLILQALSCIPCCRTLPAVPFCAWALCHRMPVDAHSSHHQPPLGAMRRIGIAFAQHGRLKVRSKSLYSPFRQVGRGDAVGFLDTR
jgi:hypothetical protein